MSDYNKSLESFMRIYKKYGALNIKNHSYLKELKKAWKATDDWLPITREVAQVLVQLKEYGNQILCHEVDEANREEGDEDYYGVYSDDLDGDKKFPEELEDLYFIKLINQS